MRRPQDFKNRIDNDLGLLQLNIVTRILNRQPFPPGGHSRDLVVQIYPQLILRITLRLGFGRPARKCLMCEDDDGYVTERTIGGPHLVGTREPDVLLLGNPGLQPPVLLTTL